MNTTKPNTFEEWLRETLEPTSIEDLAQYGADTGWPGLSYYSDTVELYNEYSEEIWDALADDAEDFGHDHPLELVATFGGAKDVYSATQFKNLLVWYMAERTARRLSEA